jgi:hypothetical protein
MKALRQAKRAERGYFPPAMSSASAIAKESSTAGHSLDNVKSVLSNMKMIKRGVGASQPSPRLLLAVNLHPSQCSRRQERVYANSQHGVETKNRRQNVVSIRPAKSAGHSTSVLAVIPKV